MGISGIKWRCPICKADVGGSMGELRNHIKKTHRSPSIQATERKEKAISATATAA